MTERQRDRVKDQTRTYETLKRFCTDRGAAGFGVADIRRVRTDDFLLPPRALDRYRFAVSLAMRVSPDVLDTLEDRPNRLYEHHYRQVNFALDRLALAVGNHIQRLGNHALPIPASQIVDWENQRAHLSHKRIAVAGGLGWLGRNNLLVTPEHGAQVRLVTVLTDLELATDRPVDQDCGKCRECVAGCPAHAIHERAEDFDHEACYELLKDFQRKRYVSQFICGLCLCGPGSG